LSALDDAGLQLAPVERAYVSDTAPLADRILHVALYVTILSSFFVFIQPAPYEYLAVLLGIACLTARVTFNRMVLPVLVLLLIRDGSGAISLFQTLDSADSIRFLATSFYLGLTAVLFACMFAQDTMRRITTLRSAYIMAAVIGSLFGTLGYFDLYFKFIPGLEIFSLNDRAVAGFKDPNVLGCFLIPPLMWLIEGSIVDKIRLRTLIASIIVFIGLLLAFSRAAWGSFLFCIVCLLYLLFVTQHDRRVRRRVLFFAVGGVVAAVAIFIMLMSIDAVNQMFLHRATLFEEYDVGHSGSRFDLQWNSVREILEHPMGMGPWGFVRIYGLVSHNSYLGSMLNHGWAGGLAYLTLVVLTLCVGFQALLVPTPWQTFLIATYLSFVALALEALVVDTDHWRHFYLLLGLVWGMAAATRKWLWQGPPRPT
jgi:hypothetical protein